MTVHLLSEAIADLPWSLREQVAGYADSVERALPEIFQQAGIGFLRARADELVFLAGLRKLHAIIASSYWTIDNAGKLLEDMQTIQVRAGAADYSRGGELHQRLHALLKTLERMFEDAGLPRLAEVSPKDLLRILVNRESD